MMNVDCQHWHGLKIGLKQVRAVKAFPQVDELEVRMRRLASDVMADPRRVEAVREDCAEIFAEMQALAASAGAPAGSAPIDVASLPASLRDLEDDAFAEVEAAVQAERTRRGG